MITELAPIIALNEFRRIHDKLYLVGEHQHACRALIDSLLPERLITNTIDLRKEIWLYHIDAHADMGRTNFASAGYSQDDLMNIFRIASSLRHGARVDIETLKIALTHIGRANYVTFLAETGLIDKVIFAANRGYDINGNLLRNVIPRNIERYDGGTVFVEASDVDSFHPVGDSVNVFWSIDTDIMALGLNDRRIDDMNITIDNASDLLKALEKQGFDLTKNNQCAVISQDQNSFNYTNTGEILTYLVNHLS